MEDSSFVLPEVNSIEHWIQKSISNFYPFSNGLAILIGCINSCNDHHPPLSGVQQDLLTLRNTFTKLLFTTLCLLDPTVEHVKKIIQTVSSLQRNGINQPDSWRRIVVTFSGHGDETHLYTRNAKISLKEDILDPLITSRESSMIGIAKLFFIDACRGNREDMGILRPPFHMRGSLLVPRGERVPSKGNYLIAYSTLIGMTAFEHPMAGGCWMQMLSKMLLEPSLVDRTILDILVKVNSKMQELMNSNDLSLQQPEGSVTLNEDILLLKEAYEIKEKYAPQLRQINSSPFQQTGPHRSWQQQTISPVCQQQQRAIPQVCQQQQQAISQVCQQQQQAISQVCQQQQRIPQVYQQQQAIPQVYQQQQRLPQVYQQQQRLPQVYQQQQRLPQVYQQHAYVHGSIVSPSPSIDQPLVSLNPATVYNMSPPSTVPLPLLGSGSSASSSVVPLTQLPARVQHQLQYSPVQQVLQNEGHNRGSEHYKNEGTTTKSRGQSLNQEASAQPLPPLTASGAGPTKSFKKMLHDYCKQGNGKPEYINRERNTGYISTLLCPGVGYVDGDLKPSAKEAENSAAHKALLKLKVLKN